MNHARNLNNIVTTPLIFFIVTVLGVSSISAQHESTAKGLRIRGTLSLPDQKPSVASNVYLLKMAKGAFTLPTQPAMIESDQTGQYAFENVEPGDYRIWAETTELTSLEDKLKGKDVKVELTTPEIIVDLVLHPGCGYTVKVLEKETGKPVPNAMISFGWTDIRRSYLTGADGVSKIGGLGRDEWYFVVKADGLATTYRKLPKQSLGSTTELEFQLAPGCDLVGRIVDEKGAPIKGATVSANETSASMTPGFGQATSDSEGRFLLKSLPRGDSIRLSASKEGYDYSSREVNIALDAKTFNHDLKLQSMAYGGDCLVIVIDEAGKPIVDASVENMGNSSANVRSAKTGQDGTAKLTNLFTSFQGTKAVVRARGYIAQRVDLSPGTPEEPGEKMVKMIRGESIRGRLLKPDGKPAAGVRVYYDRGEQGFSLGGRVDTDAEGRFVAEGLPNPCTFTFYTLPPFAPIRERKLPVGGDDEVPVQMEMEGVIRIRAIDSRTKKPIPEFNVKVGFPTNGRWAGGLSSSLINPGTEILGETKEFRLGQLSTGNCLNCTVSAKGFVKSVVENVEAVVEEGSKPLDVELQPEDASMFSIVAGKLFDSKGDPVRAALVRVMVLEAKFAKGISTNWTLIETEQIANNSSCLQFSKSTTSKDGAFKLDRIQKNGTIVVAFGGVGIASKLFTIPDHYRESDLADLEVEVERTGKLRVKVDLDAFPSAHSVSVTPTTQGILLGYTSKNISTTDSEVLFENLPQGTYQISLQSKPEDLGNGGFTTKSIKTGQAIIVEGNESEASFP